MTKTITVFTKGETEEQMKAVIEDIMGHKPGTYRFEQVRNGFMGGVRAVRI